MKIIDVKPMGMPEAKKIMANREKKKELSYEQKIALEHLNKFTRLSPADADKFLEELLQSCLEKTKTRNYPKFLECLTRPWLRFLT